MIISPRTTSRIMIDVLLALIPGTLTMAWFFGIGIIINVLVASAAAVATEALLLQIRRQSLRPLLDGSALLTGVLLGLCLPPTLPVWIITLGTFAAILFGKQLYGGLGHNPFNPAMVGYCILIVSFPLAMSLWPLPLSNTGALSMDNMIADIGFKLGEVFPDGYTMATPLDAFRFRGAATIDEFSTATGQMGAIGGTGWEWINAGFLIGGIYLIYRRVIGWVLPASLLATLTLLALLFYDTGSSDSLGSPLFHLFTGATMIAAFFILTDPVTTPDYPAGQIGFGIGVGIIIFVIRSTGAYPDGIAFAILLMNAATPLIDQLRWRRA